MQIIKTLTKTYLWACALILICTSAFAESVTLSTYYPSPFGSYDRLRLVPRSEMTGTCQVGTFYARDTDNKLQYCKDVGSGPGAGEWGSMVGLWDQNGTNFYLSENATNVNNFNGKVGIGTTTPQSTLAIRGVGITNATSSLLVTDDNDNDLFFVRDDGKVSIGVTGAMDSKLEVNGNIDLEVSNRDSQIRFQDTATNTWYSIGIDRSDGGLLRINFGGTVGAANHFSMTSDGDITIGGTISVNDGANQGAVKIRYVPDVAQPGFYATYAP
jgi:hypothetical protein